MRKRMDTSALTFDWNRARSFLAVAETGSLSAAARLLGATQPTVGRQVAALEAELSVALFERIGGRLELTPAGRALAAEVSAMAAAAARLSLAAAGRSASLEGLVRVTASDLVCAYLLGPALARLRREHPGVAVELVASTSTEDLQRRAADIAVRHFASPEPELIVRRLTDRRGWLYGTPAYLAAAGLSGPIRRSDLARAELVTFPDVDRFLAWMRGIGVELTPANTPIRCSLSLVQWGLCRAGLGLAAVMEEVGDADASVRRLDVDLPAFPVPVYLTAHRELRSSAIVRVVWDALADALG
jgi:DNA-binding transcriptional LysR family regulator